MKQSTYLPTMKLITDLPPTTTAKRTFHSRMQCNKCRLKGVKIVANTQKGSSKQQKQSALKQR